MFPTRCRLGSRRLIQILHRPCGVIGGNSGRQTSNRSNSLKWRQRRFLFEHSGSRVSGDRPEAGSQRPALPTAPNAMQISGFAGLYGLRHLITMHDEVGVAGGLMGAPHGNRDAYGYALLGELSIREEVLRPWLAPGALRVFVLCPAASRHCRCRRDHSVASGSGWVEAGRGGIGGDGQHDRRGQPVRCLTSVTALSR
jgi:hypothetical protein